MKKDLWADRKKQASPRDVPRQATAPSALAWATAPGRQSDSGLPSEFRFWRGGRPPERHYFGGAADGRLPRPSKRFRRQTAFWIGFGAPEGKSDQSARQMRPKSPHAEQSGTRFPNRRGVSRIPVTWDGPARTGQIRAGNASLPQQMTKRSVRSRSWVRDVVA